METIVIGAGLDPDFKHELASRPGGENIRRCFACGTCTAGCPVFHVDSEYNPRRLIRMILMGMREQVLRSRVIWLCAQCYACTANCPQQVDFSNIMLRLQDMAVEAGYAPADLPEKVEAISTAAHEFRRDCLRLLLGGEAPSREEILERARGTVERARPASERAAADRLPEGR